NASAIHLDDLALLHHSHSWASPIRRRRLVPPGFPVDLPCDCQALGQESSPRPFMGLDDMTSGTDLSWKLRNGDLRPRAGTEASKLEGACRKIEIHVLYGHDPRGEFGWEFGWLAKFSRASNHGRAQRHRRRALRAKWGQCRPLRDQR